MKAFTKSQQAFHFLVGWQPAKSLDADNDFLGYFDCIDIFVQRKGILFGVTERYIGHNNITGDRFNNQGARIHGMCPVLLFSKLNETWFGYFDPEKAFVDNVNN